MAAMVCGLRYDEDNRLLPLELPQRADTELACFFATWALALVLGFLAVVLATLNVVGGFAVTDRMLDMFRKKKKA